MSNKIVDGVELLRMIRDKELKKGDKVQHFYSDEIYEIGNVDLVSIENETELLSDSIGIIEFSNMEFRILSEEDEEIDVQSIEKLDEWITRRNGEVTQTEGKILDIANKTNELLKAIKQLDKKIKEKEND